MDPMSANWPVHWPMMLPFPHAIPRSRGPVPNQQSVDWPSAQFAPMYLEPGSPSFQPYSYLKNNVTLTSIEPEYTAIIPNALGPASINTYRGGPGGDIAQLPFGGPMLNNPAHHRHRIAANKRARKLAEAAQKHHRQRWAKLRREAIAAEGITPKGQQQRNQRWAKLRREAIAAEAAPKRWGWRRRGATPGGYHVRSDHWISQPVRHHYRASRHARWGARPTGIPIASGVPSATSTEMPDPVATAGLTPLYGGLALDNMGALALDNFGDCATCNYGEEGWFIDEDGRVKWAPTLFATVAFMWLAVELGFRL